VSSGSSVASSESTPNQASHGDVLPRQLRITPRRSGHIVIEDGVTPGTTRHPSGPATTTPGAA